MLALLLSGCGSAWWPVDFPHGVECVDMTWFPDADGDGWGWLAPGEEPKVGCAPEGQFKARNDLDCDDDDPEVTARIGAACPSDLAADFVAAVSWSAEVLVARAPSEPLSQAQAGTSCAAWGGTPFAPTDPRDLAVVEDMLPQEWAGWADAGALAALGVPACATPGGAWVAAPGGPPCLGDPATIYGAPVALLACERPIPVPDDWDYWPEG